MSMTNDDVSDIKQAAEQVDVQEMEQNLKDKKQVDSPEPLTEQQKTSFIDEDVRTDK